MSKFIFILNSPPLRTGSLVKKMKAAIIGDLAVDNIVYQDISFQKGGNLLLEDIQTYPGGVAGNIAFYLKQCGIEPVVYSAVGDDEEGKFLTDDLKERKISTEHVKVLKGKTGFLIIIVDSSGERTMIGSKGAAYAFNISSRNIVSSSPSWIHISGYVLLGKYGNDVWKAAVSSSKKLNIPLSLGLEGIHKGKFDDVDTASILLCNRMEFENFFNDGFDEVAKKAKTKIVVKADREGCYILDGNVKRIEGERVQKVIDTTGAGDAFDAALIASLLKYRDLEESCKVANLFAAQKVKKRGNKVIFSRSMLSKYFR